MKNAGHKCRYCDRGAIARRMCAAHYSRKQRGFKMNKPLVPRYKGLICSAPNCEEKARRLKLCNHHYHRHRSGIPLDAPPRAPRAEGYISGYGYRVFVVDGERRFEHHMVIEKELGRRLTKGENVHHLNGVRLDNRRENLELWSRAQPAGQRVRDKVKWARELLATYGHLYPESPELEPVSK